jgi:uncharacterized protein
LKKKDGLLENPLRPYIPVEERVDGVYITITREVSSTLAVGNLIGALEKAGVMNFDAQHINDVVKRARGAFEKIGPLFEYYNPEIEKYVDVSIAPLQASMKLNSMCITNNCKPSVAILLRCLERKGVRFGVKTEMVSGILHNMLFDSETVIAEGKNPVRGQDASIQMEVKIEHDFKPQEKTDGKVDFRNVNTITQIRAGQVIAKKVPATPGVPGRSVTGNEIPAMAGSDARFPGGKNTRVSDDGLFLLAVKNGFVYKDGEIIHVGDMLPIPKDVDFSVGNIKYMGDIQIQGNVLPGFTVETEGSIIINGRVEAAKIISRNESIEIQKGVIGKNETYISAKKKIHVEFAQDAIMVSEGVVSIKKSCLHCESTSMSFEAKEAHATVVGGHIRAFANIELSESGNETGIMTKLSLVDKNEAANKEKLKDLELLQKKLADALEPIKKQLKTKAAILKMSGSATERITDELKKWLTMYNDGTAKLKYVDQSIVAIKEKLKNPEIHDGFIKIYGTAYPGTELNFFGITKILKVAMTGKTFRLKNGVIETDG